MSKNPIRQALATAKSESIYKALSLLPPEARLTVQYWRAYHRKLDLRNPKLFTEKMQALKLTPWLSQQGAWVDKIEAKASAARVLGPEWIIPTLWAGDVLPPREERTWPTPFFIKASHGSGWNRYVPDETAKDWDVIERDCAKWLRTPWPRQLMEVQYDVLQRRVLVEPRIGTGDELPSDFKFWVFNGRVEYVSITAERLAGAKIVFLDRNWRRIESVDPRYRRKELGHVPPPPKHIHELITAAEKIGALFPFVRVDLYDLPEGPVFGEVTLTPASGLEPGHPPDEVDGAMGEMIDMRKYNAPRAEPPPLAPPKFVAHAG